MVPRDIDGTVERLRYWCQLVLPAVFDDSLSYYELVCKVSDKLNEVIDANNELAGHVADNVADIKELQELFRKFVESGFDDYYKAQVDKWIDEHLSYIFTKVAKQVYFGLTDNGYFTAYIPEGWEDIMFDTGAVYGRTDYGRLILKFNVDGEGVIDNTYSYSLAQPEDVAKLAADLEINTKRTDSCFDTLYTSMNETISESGDNV